jgi:acyl-CoA thioester hydrolase
MSIQQFSLIHPLRVRWAEADMQGVVFNAHYMAYFDIAVTEYWRVLSKGDQAWLAETFEHLYVVKATLEFHRPARFDDELTVAVRCARLGRSSMTKDFEIRRGEDHLISGQSIYVYAQEGKSMPIPDGLRRRIHAFEKIPPL